MAKLIFGLALVTGFAMFAIAVIGAPATHGVATGVNEPQQAATAAGGCSIEQFALDEGYGVSRTIARRTCAESK